MEHLKLPPRSRRIGCDDDVLRPTENSINPNLLRSNAGNRGVLRQVAEIKNVRLDRQAFAKILGIRLQYAIGSAVQPTLSNANTVRNPTTKIRFIDAPIRLMPKALEGHSGYSSIAVSRTAPGCLAVAVAPTGVEGRPGKERCRALRQGKFSAALEGLTDGLLGALPDGQGHFVA